MKAVFITTALFLAVFVCCKKSDDRPPQYFTYDGFTGKKVGVYFKQWYQESNNVQLLQFEGSVSSDNINFEFTRKPDHTMRYKIVSYPGADDEVCVSGWVTSGDTTGQYLNVAMSGSNIHLSATDVVVYLIDPWWGPAPVHCSFDLTDQ